MRNVTNAPNESNERAMAFLGTFLLVAFGRGASVPSTATDARRGEETLCASVAMVGALVIVASIRNRLANGLYLGLQNRHPI